ASCRRSSRATRPRHRRRRSFASSTAARRGSPPRVTTPAARPSSFALHPASKARSRNRMATFLVAHGAWSAGWAWKKMRPLMAARGHALFAPTCTGLGERAHLAHRDINLETHIADVLAVLEIEDLRDVILIGHSYGGMVATGVADRA